MWDFEHFLIGFEKINKKLGYFIILPMVLMTLLKNIGFGFITGIFSLYLLKFLKNGEKND
ncbi:MAG: hypothetical protein ACP5OB_06675 [Candidatus Ratteibacteria bacterium]